VWLVWPPSLFVESCCSESQAGRWLTLPRSKVPAGARDPPSIALLPSVWRSLRWCKEEWPQGLPTDPHWRHHSTICLSAEGSAATHIRAMLYGSRGRKKRAGFTLLAHLSQDSRLLTLNTCPLGKMLYVPGVASTPSSATSLIGRSFSARA
jgi:hypothetical protein